MRRDGLLKFFLFAFTITGVNPIKRNWLAAILCTVSIGSFVFMNMLYIVDMALNWNGVKSLGKLSMYPAAFMMLVKTLVLRFNTKTLNEIINQISTLNQWNTTNEKLNKRLKTAYNLAKAFTMCFFGMCCVAVVAFTSMPFLTNDPSLYFDAYWFCDNNQNPCFIYHFVWQHFVLFLAFPNVIGFDCLFIYFVTVVYISIEIIKDTVNEIGTGNYNAVKVKEFVNKHNQIIMFIKELNNFYSILMLLQSWASLSGLILSLYMITFEGIPPPLRLVTKYGSVLIIFAFQFFIYCIGGNIIIEETKTISDAAFFIDWWSQTKGNLRRALVLVIQRSQKVEKITVGGVMDLNLECFVWVLKNSMSVYTLLLTMEKKANMLKE